MNKVYICSPLRGDYDANIAAARTYCREAVEAGHLPVAPHIYLTQFLDDNKPEERSLGLALGRQLLEDCDELWVYGEPSEGIGGVSHERAGSPQASPGRAVARRRRVL